MKTNLILFIILLPLMASTQIITVKQDGTGDFTTIQAAVDSAANGDTVLVWPGTYVENMDINEKHFTLGSLTLITGDETYKYQTVIDGNKNGSCLKLWNWNVPEKVIINGFTIRNGSGSNCGGICGGGIFIEYSNIEIYNCVVKNNIINTYGGGIYLYGSNAFLSNVTITYNQAYDRGGGMLLLNSTATFDTISRCNIYENYAAVGTDVYKLGSPPMDLVVDTFTVQNPDYYYIFSADSIQRPQHDVVFSILHHKIEQVSENLYVSPTGNNNNSGLLPSQSLKTISFALLKMASDSVSPDTILVDNGIYSFSSGEKFPLSLKKFVSIKGTDRDSVILDAEDEIYLLNGIFGATDYTVSNLTLENGNGSKNSNHEMGGVIILENDRSSFDNIVIKHCRADFAAAGRIINSNGFVIKNSLITKNISGNATFRIGHGDATFYSHDTVYIINTKFTYNYPDTTFATQYGKGGALAVIGQGRMYPHLINTTFMNCLFTENHSEGYHGSVISNALALVYSAKVFVVNNTFSNNILTNSEGANIGVTYKSELNIYNSILFNNEPAEFYMFNLSDWDTNKLNIYHSLVDGGEENIRILTGGNILYYDTTNIDTDPLFYGGPDFPYNLSNESPCIDAGTLDLPQFILDNMPDTDLAGNPRIVNDKIDMGCYEWNPTVGVEEQPATSNQQPAGNLKVFPNPFSSQTTIAARWETTAQVNIEIYNAAGLLVKTLQSGKQLPGSCQIPWDGTDNIGNKLPAGIYFVVLRVNGREKESAKVVWE